MQAVARNIFWLGFFAAILAAWWALFGMARMSGVDFFGRPVGVNMMSMTGFWALFPMWSVMMAAMMLPTLVPTLRSYEDLMQSANGTRAGWVGVVAGFFAVWVGFAALIAALQVMLMRTGLVDDLGIATSLWITAALLIGTGLYQFSWIKDVCHGVCLTPMTYFLGRWRPGAAGGLRMGSGLGAYCVGCCWGFMVLGFVGGVMSLLWMGAATLFMVLEKLPQIGHYTHRPAGYALVAAGGAVALKATGFF